MYINFLYLGGYMWVALGYLVVIPNNIRDRKVVKALFQMSLFYGWTALAVMSGLVESNNLNAEARAIFMITILWQMFFWVYEERLDRMISVKSKR